jgi:hypothetical protein
MKHPILLLLACAPALLISQAPPWQWVRSCDSVNAAQHGRDVCTDPYGSVYFLADNGQDAWYPDGKREKGNVLSKYRHDGQFLWSKSLPGSVKTIKSDKKGYIYVAANFDSTVHLGNAVLVSTGETDLYVTKLDGSGIPVWTKTFGGPADDQVRNLDVSVNNNVHVAGSLTGPFLFGGFMVTDTSAFVAKLTEGGGVQWVNTRKPYQIQLDTNYSVWGRRTLHYEVTSDKNEEVYVLGVDEGYCMYCVDYYLTKYSASGQEILDKQMWSIFDYPGGLTVDSKGDLYVMSNTGSHYTSSIVLQKYSSSLAPLWSRYLGNGYDNFAISAGIVLGKNDDPCVTGWLGGSTWAHSDTVMIDSAVYISAGRTNFAVWQLNGATGKTQWMKLGGGKGMEMAEKICTDVAGNYYVAGSALRHYDDPLSSQKDTCDFDGNSVVVHGKVHQGLVTKLKLSDHIFFYDAAGLADSHSAKSPLVLSPNPGNGRVTISGLRGEEEFSVNVADFSGKQVYRQTLSQPQLDLSFLEKGIYLISINSNVQNGTARLVISE